MTIQSLYIKHKVFLKQNGILIFLSFTVKKLFFALYKHLFKKCGCIFIAGSFRISGKQNIEIVKLFAGRRIVIDAIKYFNHDIYTPSIVIGQNVSLSDDIHIACTNKIKIGNNVLMGSHIYISDHDHGIYSGNKIEHSSPEEQPAKRKLTNDGFVIIEDNVHIGEYVCILKNTRIGRGAVIGAQSVVTGDIPEYSVAAGNPAKVIKKYDFDKQIWIRADNEIEARLISQCPKQVFLD
jgi:acetyltransferase-like isoleucine patch superfamily enzyme